MAENTLKATIKLKYNTLSNWVSKNPVLSKGEVAVATINTQYATKPDGTTNPPQILIKVGDGATAYNSLNFASALAADVYSWAKAATKPSYSASEISGLDSYINETILSTGSALILDCGNANIQTTEYALILDCGDATI